MKLSTAAQFAQRSPALTDEDQTRSLPLLLYLQPPLPVGRLSDM